MTAYSRGKVDQPAVRTDLDVLREHHRFLLDEAGHDDEGWEMRMVRSYHNHLYKEYALADLSRIGGSGSSIGLRWRTEKEVVNGRGQFTCGSLHCSNAYTLTSWELPFGYAEQGQQKIALVKIRLCPDCSDLLPDSKRNRHQGTSSDFLP